MVLTVCLHLFMNLLIEVPEDAYFSLRILVHCVSTLETDGKRDAAEIKALLETTTFQASTIASLHSKVEQLELASLAQPYIKLTAQQDDLDNLR